MYKQKKMRSWGILNGTVTLGHPETGNEKCRKTFFFCFFRGSKGKGLILNVQVLFYNCTHYYPKALHFP
jgi:hypothetical protein